MSEHAVFSAGGHRWYSRPVLFVADLNRALRFHVERLFIELTAEGLRDFRRELAERSVSTRAIWWVYDATRVSDPDGNEMLFPAPE